MSSPSRRRRAAAAASITDVAALAGVSAQTVSRVSTGSAQVRESTRVRVQEAMDRLGYVPNRAARALRGGSSGAIGLVGHDFGRTGELFTMRAVVLAAEERGYSVNVINVHDGTNDDWNRAVRRLPEQPMDALILVRAELVDPELVSLPPSLPVCVSGYWPGSPHASVQIDHVQGMVLAVEHLLALGHRTVHHVAGPADSGVAQARAQAWRRTLTLHGISPPEAIEGDWTAESGRRAADELLARPDVTAVACGNDETAIGLIQALHERGVRIPEDVSVVGYDDIDLAPYVTPALTTVRQDFHAIGEQAVGLVLDQLDRLARGERPTFPHVTIPVDLVVRHSTAAPPAVSWSSRRPPAAGSPPPTAST
ncbi:LacI family DNA-binding transcriptional regulator [Aestuariimicrobium soli]|uniref:LacI family DNA-binding transcriptional regulator n=1 Tax=Aestuariimicrobium soli TaxID=2035834 RepID=UPI003EB96E07